MCFMIKKDSLDSVIQSYLSFCTDWLISIYYLILIIAMKELKSSEHLQTSMSINFRNISDNEESMYCPLETKGLRDLES